MEGRLSGRSHESDSDSVANAGHEPKRASEGGDDRGSDRALPPAQSGANQAKRDRGRRQRPEEDGHFADLSVGTETNVVDPLDVLAADPCVPDEKCRVLAAELSIRFFWTISQAQIYPSLERLEHSGLVDGRSEPQGKRPRRVFEITHAGEAALRDWLKREEPMPFELRDVGMLKLFFADAQDHDDGLALLAAVKHRSEQRVSTLREIESAAQLAEQAGNAYPLLTLQMGIAFHQAMIDTCAQFERKLKEREP